MCPSAALWPTAITQSAEEPRQAPAHAPKDGRSRAVGTLHRSRPQVGHRRGGRGIRARRRTHPVGAKAKRAGFRGHGPTGRYKEEEGPAQNPSLGGNMLELGNYKIATFFEDA